MSVLINIVHISDIRKRPWVTSWLGEFYKTVIFIGPCLYFPTICSLLIHLGPPLSLPLLVPLNITSWALHSPKMLFLLHPIVSPIRCKQWPPSLCKEFRKGFLSVTHLGGFPPGEVLVLLLWWLREQQLSRLPTSVGYWGSSPVIAHLIFTGSLCVLISLQSPNRTMWVSGAIVWFSKAIATCFRAFLQCVWKLVGEIKLDHVAWKRGEFLAGGSSLQEGSLCMRPWQATNTFCVLGWFLLHCHLRHLCYDSHSLVSAQLICRTVSLNCCCHSQGHGNKCNTHTLVMHVLGLVSVFIWSYHLICVCHAFLQHSVSQYKLIHVSSKSSSLDYYPNLKKI